MIDYSILPDVLPNNINQTNNSGVIFVWMLAQVFNFDFDLEEFFDAVHYKEREGTINGKDIKLYINSKKLYYYDSPQGTSLNVDLQKLHKNDVVAGIRYKGYGKDKIVHMSLLLDLQVPEFTMVYGNPNYNDLNLVNNLYMFFVSKSPDISEQLIVDSNPKIKLNRSPNYE